VENGIPFFAPLWTRTPAVCVVHHIHREQWRQHFPRPVAAFGWMLERLALRHVHRNSRYFTVSASTAEALEALGVARERIDVAVIGVEAPRELPHKSDQPLFVALGRLVPHKRVDAMLDAWRIVQPHTGGTLVVVGDGPERSRLEQNAPPGVVFRGFVDEDEKHQLLARAWLLVHAAHHEGWGMAITEAAARNTPAIALDAPGVRDAIVNGRTGILAAGIPELATAWRALAADPARRRELGDAARSRARTFGWDATVRTMITTLEHAVDDSRAPRPVSARDTRAA